MPVGSDLAPGAREQSAALRTLRWASLIDALGSVSIATTVLFFANQFEHRMNAMSDEHHG